MKNVNLNPGGLIGALVVGGAAAAIVFSFLNTTHSRRGPFKLVILALIGGAIGGNFLWELVFGKKE